jgi:hypothetical protein
MLRWEDDWMICRLVSLVLLLNCQLLSPHAWAEMKKDLGLQPAENPPMQVIARTSPAPAPLEKEFEIRELSRPASKGRLPT